MRLPVRLALALTPVIVAACGVHTEKAVAKAAVDTTSTEQRKTSFEATAQLLDERPELVDELYGVMRLHPKALDRFLAFASTDLDQKWMAKNMASYLAKNPAGVEEILDATIPAIEKEPKSRAAMNRSLTKHAEQTADILSDDPHALARVVASLLAMTQKREAARKNLVTAMHEDREALVAFVKEDKPLARAIAVEVLRETVKDKPTLRSRRPVAARCPRRSMESDRRCFRNSTLVTRSCARRKLLPGALSWGTG